MKTIITIQHTQSIHHTNGMVGSWTDWELSEKGLQHCLLIFLQIFQQRLALISGKHRRFLTVHPPQAVIQTPLPLEGALQITVRVEQLDTVGKQVIDLIHKRRDRLRVKSIMDGRAKVDIKINAIIAHCLFFVICQGGQHILIGADTLIHRRAVAQEIVLPVQRAQEYAILRTQGKIAYSCARWTSSSQISRRCPCPSFRSVRRTSSALPLRLRSGVTDPGSTVSITALSGAFSTSSTSCLPEHALANAITANISINMPQIFLFIYYLFIFYLFTS